MKTFIIPFSFLHLAIHFAIHLAIHHQAHSQNHHKVHHQDPKKSHREWQIYHGDYGGSHYSELDQINRSNVKDLEVAWIWKAGETGRTIECNPIIVNGIVFLTTPRLHCVALDGETGKMLWRFQPYKKQNGVNRGVAYWTDGKGDDRIFHSAGDHLYALNAKTGKPISSFGNKGHINHKDGFDTDVFFLSIGNNTPGMVWKNLLILGSTTGEGPQASAPGHVRAFDVRTGKRIWIFHTIPHPGEFGYETWGGQSWKNVGSANVWSGFTLDAEREIIFMGTGSPAYDHWGGNRPGKGLFGNCTIALDVNSGKRLWHFQAVHHDLWDYDLPTPPVLARLERNGKLIDALVQPTKMGHLFVLDRLTGKPLFPVEEVPVPQSQIPDEHSFPTQPFPPKAFQLAMTKMDENNVTDLNYEARNKILKDLETMEKGSVFTPPSFRKSVMLPQFNGGCEWGGAAFDPSSNTIFVNVSNEAEYIQMTEASPRKSLSLHNLGRHLYHIICAFCHGHDSSNSSNSSSSNSSFGISSSSLQNVKKRLTKLQVSQFIRKGQGQMPSFESLNQTEQKAIISFLFDEGHDDQIEIKDLTISFASQVPFLATGHHEWRDDEGFPANKRPWGTLNAIDLSAGKLRWKVPLGTYPELEARGESATGTFNIGGPIVTKGGLVLIGASMDERFHAFDKDTGELLWEYQLEAGGYATPSTYEIEGRQYIIIAAGGGGKPGTKKGDAYYCFALPKK